VFASEDRGYDGGKKTKCRKRLIVTGIMGNLLSVFVNSATPHYTKTGIVPTLRAFAKYTSLYGSPETPDTESLGRKIIHTGSPKGFARLNNRNYA